MIDLIEKIHELKDYENYDYDQAITDVEILLDQYNIITAPKTIKLSEIVNRLNKTLKEHLLDSYIDVLIKRHKIEKDKNKSYVTVFHAGKSYQNQGENYLFSFWNNESISKPEHTCFKWLYALWIAGTIIEDDLKEE